MLKAVLARFNLTGNDTRIDPRGKDIFHFFAPCTALASRFRFEWHTKSQQLYVVDIALGERTQRVVANLMAYHIENQGSAHNAALIWCRGFLAAEEGRTHNDQGKIVLLGEHS